MCTSELHLDTAKASCSSGSRAANTRTIDSASRRLATKASTCDDEVIEPLRIVDEAQKRTLLGSV
jgi:hypothetical protein